MALVDVRGVEFLDFAGGAFDDEIVAEDGEIPLETYAKVTAVRAKLEVDDIVTSDRSLRSQVIPMDVIGGIRERLVMAYVLVQSSS